jgi:hypothetical protein
MSSNKLKMFANTFMLIKLGYIFEAKEYKSVCEAIGMLAV